MRPEETHLIKPTFTFIRSLKKKEIFKVLILLSVFLCVIISPGAAASSSWKITPENPVVGDVMEIKGNGFTGENVGIQVTFEKEVQVVDGSYEYTLEDIVIPSGGNNSFTVQATGADELNVRAKTLLWITKTAEAKGGVATVSQTGVPPGTYKIRIDGKSNASSVKIKITAIQDVEVDSEGNLNYEYDTNSIPAGNFEINVGGIVKQVELQPGESEHSEITSSSKQNSSEGERAEENSWNNLKFILSYPDNTLRSFYTVNETVKISYKGPETLGQHKVDIYLVKEHNSSFPENAISNCVNESAISLEDVLNANTESYIQIPATLNENGDLSPLTLGSLPAGNYWVLITLAGNETERPELEKETIFAKFFEVLKYEMEAEVPDTIEEGKNVEVNFSLKNAPAQKNYTYWALLLREGTYKADEDTNSSWIIAGTRPIVNGVDVIKSLETNLTKDESRDKREKLREEVQTLVRKEDGTISIGEENQSTLSLKSLELPPGNYLLVAGANENNEELVGIVQKELKISADNSKQNSSEQDSIEEKTEKLAKGISDTKRISTGAKEPIQSSLDLKSQKVWIAGILAGITIILMYLNGKKA